MSESVFIFGVNVNGGSGQCSNGRESVHTLLLLLLLLLLLVVRLVRLAKCHCYKQRWK